MAEHRLEPLGRVLVTGATGQVGRRLVSALLDDGERVRVLTRGGQRVCDRLWPGAAIEHHPGDLTQPASLTGCAHDIDSLFHLASYAPRPDEPDLYNAPGHWQVTAAGTDALLAALAGSPVRRILYISSIRATGAREQRLGRPAPTPDPPDSRYGRAKRHAEQAVLAWGTASGRRACVLRLPMVYGLDGAGNLPRMLDAVARGRFPPWPRRANRRAAVHVDDAVAAALLAARHPGSAGRCYGVSDGGAYSTRWLYETMCQALGRTIPDWSMPYALLWSAAAVGSLAERLARRRMPLTLEGLRKLDGDAWLDTGPLQRDLGFVPRQGLADEIRRLAHQRRP